MKTENLLPEQSLAIANGEIKRSNSRFVRVGKSLYRRGGVGVIYARVRVNRRSTWRSTETDDLSKARKWLAKWRDEEWAVRSGIELPGVVLHRQRVSVGELIKDYEDAGFPTKKMQPKSAATLRNERFFLSPIRAYFGDRIASAITLQDCDKYRDWRSSGGYVSTYKVRGGHLRTIKTKGGNRCVDLELTVLSNVFNLSVRRNVLKSNPFDKRGRYSVASEVRHCREVAPTPEGLNKIGPWLRSRNEHAVADLVYFLAFSGLRIGEALPLTWGAVSWSEQILHVTREKRGTTSWVRILPAMAALLKDMKKRATGDFLFPSPFDATKPRDVSAVRHRLTAACKKLGIGHVTLHGLRSYFVTQARQSGLSDAVIAALIGDKTGAPIIAHTYGDWREDHLIEQADRIQLTGDSQPASSIKSSNTPQGVVRGSTV